jgi:hypothetical protein
VTGARSRAIRAAQLPDRGPKCTFDRTGRRGARRRRAR